MTVFTALGATGMPQLFAISREAVIKSHFTERAFANSTLRSAFSLGFITGPLIGTLLLAAIGFKGIFWERSELSYSLLCLFSCFSNQTQK